MRLFVAALCAAMVLSTQLAHSGDSANEVMPGCRDQVSQAGRRVSDAAYCLGLVVGIAWAHQSICIPVGAQYGQLVRVVVKYIDDRPQRLHEFFPRLALEALSTAWPCKPSATR